jgi:fucose 4-O-acetylase-like acetyltransferase
MKLGVILIVFAFAWLWAEHTNMRRSIARQLGTTSLIVYWVHIELVYGRWLGAWRESFNAVQCALAAAAVIALMVGVSLARSDWPGMARRARFKLPAMLLPESAPFKSQRAAGD